MIKIAEIKEKRIWEDFVLSQRENSFLQSWNWGKVNELMGGKIFRLGLFEDKKLTGGSLIIKTRAKRGTHLLVPGGPLIPWQKQSCVKTFFNYLKNLGKEEKCWFIRVRPELPAGGESQKMFRNLGFLDAPMHLHAENTWELDITKSEEEIFKGMRKTTRYLVRQGEKLGLTLEKSIDPRKAKILFRLQEETVARHGFVGFPEKIFRYQMETFGKDNQGSLFLVSYRRKIIAAAIFIFYGETAYYHHSGTSSLFPKVPASYFMIWEAIKEAKRRGLKRFNFWGISPKMDPHHRFYGVTLFKMGFGGQRKDLLHAQDYPVSPLYWLTFTFESVRRIARRL